MTQKELYRAQVVIELSAGKLTTRQAAERLGLKEYQLVNPPTVRRLQHQTVEVVKLLTGKLLVRLQNGPLCGRFCHPL